MGNDQGKDISSNQYKNYEVISKNVYEGLGEFSVCKEHTTNQIILFFESTYSITNPELARTEIQQLEKMNSIKHACRLLDFDITKSKLLCLENFSLNLVFEHHLLNLENLMDSDPNGKVKENEVWLIVSDLLSYLGDLHNMGLEHGDLQPTNILFNNNRVVKVLSPLIYTTFQNAYDYRLANEGYKSTFSPELLESFEHRVQNPNVDNRKSDIFSLGICLLCLVSNERYYYFYDFNKNIIFFDRIKIKLADMIKNGYKEQLFHFINLCLKENVYDRATLEKLVKLNGLNKVGISGQFWKGNY